MVLHVTRKNLNACIAIKSRFEVIGLERWKLKAAPYFYICDSV